MSNHRNEHAERRARSGAANPEAPTESGAPPPAGTPAAVAAGCPCPTLANSPDAAAATDPPLIAPDCPLHQPHAAGSSGDTTL